MLSQVLMTGYPIVLTALCGYIVWLLQEQRKETKKKEAEIEKHQGYIGRFNPEELISYRQR